MQFKTSVEIEGDFKGNCEITWEVELECRSWGVKSISIFACDQEISFVNTREDENGDEIEEDVTLKLEDISCEHSFSSLSDTLCPHELQINKDGGKLDVSLHF